MLIVQRPRLKPTKSKLIPLTRGFFSIVDEADFDWLNQRRWRAKKSASSIYAVCRIKKNGKTKEIRMHRLLMDTPKHMKSHHINHNSLDNRRVNLMNVTEREHRHYDGWHIFERQ